jgi:hypothetical protein
MNFDGNWMGFNIYALPMYQGVAVFKELIPILSKLDWKKEGFYFNCYSNHARFGLRINASKTDDIVKEIKDKFKEMKLPERQKADSSSTDYWVGFPVNEQGGEYDGSENELEKQKHNLKLKEIGTKCAVIIKDSLGIGSLPYDRELQTIAGVLHFIINPLVHNYGGYASEIDVYERAMKRIEGKLKD